MPKIAIHITVDYDLYENAKNRGINISEACENGLLLACEDQKLVEKINKFRNIPTLKLQMIKRILTDKPDKLRFWTDYIKKNYDVDISDKELWEYVCK